MSLSPSTIQSIQAKAILISFQFYLDYVSRDLVGNFAQFIDNRQTKQTTINLEFLGSWAKMHLYKDKTQFEKWFHGVWNVTPRHFEAAHEYNTLELEKDENLLTVAKGSEALGIAAANHPMELVSEALIDNGLTYDTKALFATDHAVPGQPDLTFSNLISYTKETATFTFADAKNIIEQAKVSFLATLGVTQRMIPSTQLAKFLSFIAYDDTTFKAFEQVRTKTTIEDDENEYAGTFSLYRDTDANDTLADETVQVVYSAPNTPKPILYAVTTEPTKLLFDTSKVISDYRLVTKLYSEVIAVPGFPHGAQRFLVSAP